MASEDMVDVGFTSDLDTIMSLCDFQIIALLAMSFRCFNLHAIKLGLDTGLNGVDELARNVLVG